MSHLTHVALALLVSALAACGGKSSARPDIEGTGATGAGGSGTGGSGTSGSGSGGKGQAGNAGAGGAAVCSSLDDDFPTSVSVLISNQTTAAIYLGQTMVTCGVSPLFDVADAAGAPLPSLGSCRSACDLLRQQGVGGCVASCAFPNAVALQPGEVMYTTWDGLFGVQGELPTQCLPYDAGGAGKVSCDQAKRIEPGTFTFSARAGSRVDCSQTSPDGACSACTALPNGGCSAGGALIAGPLHTTQAVVTLDGSFGVYPAPSSSPGANAGNAEPAPGVGDAPVLRAVELIFTK